MEEALRVGHGSRPDVSPSLLVRNSKHIQSHTYFNFKTPLPHIWLIFSTFGIFSLFCLNLFLTCLNLWIVGNLSTPQSSSASETSSNSAHSTMCFPELSMPDTATHLELPMWLKKLCTIWDRSHSTTLTWEGLTTNQFLLSLRMKRTLFWRDWCMTSVMESTLTFLTEIWCHVS